MIKGNVRQPAVLSEETGETGVGGENQSHCCMQQSPSTIQRKSLCHQWQDFTCGHSLGDSISYKQKSLRTVMEGMDHINLSDTKLMEIRFCQSQNVFTHTPTPKGKAHWNGRGKPTQIPKVRIQVIRWAVGTLLSHFHSWLSKELIRHQWQKFSSSP